MTDLKLCMTRDSLPFTPFYCFVAPDPFPFKGPELFHRFMDLPLEIHRMIFHHCDAPTLFHIMHASSYTRRECSALFWEPEHNTWYRPDNAHLLFEDQNFRLYHCPEFASRVKQVEINIEYMELNRVASSGQAFWEKLRSLFPSVQNVVLSGKAPKHSLPPHCGVYDRDYSPVSDLVDMAPPNITALVAFKYGGSEGALRYRLWRVGACWSIVEDSWTPMRVLIPAKKIPSGLLNDFLSMERAYKDGYSEFLAREWLALDTYARYPESRGIDCPSPWCNAKFPMLEQLKEHIAYGSFERFQKPCGRYMIQYHRNTPVEVKAALDTKQRRSEETFFLATVLNEELREQYRQNGEAGREQFQDTLARQMKEYEIVGPDQSLVNSESWYDLFDVLEDGEDDYPEYPDEDFDRDYPDEEDIHNDYAERDYNYEYAGEEYM